MRDRAANKYKKEYAVRAAAREASRALRDLDVEAWVGPGAYAGRSGGVTTGWACHRLADLRRAIRWHAGGYAAAGDRLRAVHLVPADDAGPAGRPEGGAPLAA